MNILWFTQCMSVLFWHCHILYFQLQINVIKSDDKPRMGSHLMLFQQILSLEWCLGFQTILQTITRTSMNLISFPLCKLFQFDLLLRYSFLGSYKYLIVMGSKDIQLAQSGCISACQFKLAQSVEVCLQKYIFFKLKKKTNKQNNILVDILLSKHLSKECTDRLIHYGRGLAHALRETLQTFSNSDFSNIMKMPYTERNDL